MKMVGERPLGLTFLALLEAIMAIIEMNIGSLMLFPGNPFNAMFPGLDMVSVSIMLIVMGVLGLFIGYSLWTGQAFGWVTGVIMLVVDLIVRIVLPVFYGMTWIAFVFGIELDYTLLFDQALNDTVFWRRNSS
jgi:hypothetical protein